MAAGIPVFADVFVDVSATLAQFTGAPPPFTGTIAKKPTRAAGAVSSIAVSSIAVSSIAVSSIHVSHRPPDDNKIRGSPANARRNNADRAPRLTEA
jgi:hypothetical protein